MAEETGFRPQLGLGSVTALIVGSIIGSGIFFTPALMVGYVHSAPLVMLAWVAGAILTLAGALTFAELAAAFPRAGGQMEFIREGLGRLPAFLFSWSGFTVVQSGTVAAIAVAFANTLDYIVALPGSEVEAGFLRLPKWGVSFVAVALVWLLTAVNLRGVREAAAVNNLASVLKVGALLFVAAVALLFGDPAGNFDGFRSALGAAGLGAFGLAVSESLFAYDGWAQATFVAAEVKDARRVVPKAIVLGVLAVAAIYLLVTFAYFHVLPVAGITDDTDIAQETADAAVGGWAAAVVAVGILVSTFGATNSYVLASPRIYFGLARDGDFPAAFGRLNRTATPGHGLWYQGLWASLLALTGTFEALSLLVVFALWLFYLVTAIAYFRLRGRPEMQGLRMPLSPLPAVVFAVAAAAITVNFLVQDVSGAGSAADLLGSSSGLGLLLILSGLLVYAVRRARRAA